MTYRKRMTASKRRRSHMQIWVGGTNYSLRARARRIASRYVGAARGRGPQSPWFEPESSSCCFWCPPSAPSLERGIRRTPCLKRAYPRPTRRVRLPDLHPCPCAWTDSRRSWSQVLLLVRRAPSLQQRRRLSQCFSCVSHISNPTIHPDCRREARHAETDAA